MRSSIVLMGALMGGLVSHSAAQAGQCQPATTIVITRAAVGGGTETLRFDLRNGVARVPSQTLSALEVASQYVGKDKIQSARFESSVRCGTTATAQRYPSPTGGATTAATGSLWLCMGPDMIVYDCIMPAGQGYFFGGGGSCTTTGYGSGVFSIDCADSHAWLMANEGKVIIHQNAEDMSREINSRMEVMRSLIANVNLISNPQFNFSIDLDPSLLVVSPSQYSMMSQVIQEAVQAGKPLPNLDDLLRRVPNPPPPQSLVAELELTYGVIAQKLDTLANITGSTVLSPLQIQQFYNRFVVRSEQLDRALVQGTAGGLQYVTDELNNTVRDLSALSPNSPSYRQAKAGYESLLGAYTSNGVFWPQMEPQFEIPLATSLTSRVLEDRLFAADVRVAINEAIQGLATNPDSKYVIAALAWADLAYAQGYPDQAYRLYDRAQTYLYYQQGGSYDEVLTQAARQQYGLDTDSSTFLGYEVTSIANQLAELDLASDPSVAEYYDYAKINLHAALASSVLAHALYHLEQASTVLSVFMGLGRGLLDSAIGTIEGVWGTITHPIDTVEGLASAIINYERTYELIKKNLLQTVEDFPNLTPAEQARLIGKITGDILQTLAGGAASAKLVTATRGVVQRIAPIVQRVGKVVPRAQLSEQLSVATRTVETLERLGAKTADDVVNVVNDLRERLPDVDVDDLIHRADKAGFTSASDLIEATENAQAMASRANELHSVLHPIAQNHRTTAVLDSSSGRIIAEGKKDLSPAQRAALQAGEIPAKLIGADAELTAFHALDELGGAPNALGVSRKMCPDCRDLVLRRGGVITNPNTAVWPRR